jgi:hypothetical protein
MLIGFALEIDLQHDDFHELMGQVGRIMGWTCFILKTVFYDRE